MPVSLPLRVTRRVGTTGSVIFLVLDDLGHVTTLLCNFFSHGLLEYAPGGREPHGASNPGVVNILGEGL